MNHVVLVISSEMRVVGEGKGREYLAGDDEHLSHWQRQE